MCSIRRCKLSSACLSTSQGPSSPTTRSSSLPPTAASTTTPCGSPLRLSSSAQPPSFPPLAPSWIRISSLLSFPRSCSQCLLSLLTLSSLSELLRFVRLSLAPFGRLSFCLFQLGFPRFEWAHSFPSCWEEGFLHSKAWPPLSIDWLVLALSP